VNDGKRLYEWDVQNRLIRVIVPNEGEVRFRYRADGMRVEKQVVGGLTTKYVYDGQTVIGEMRSDGTKRWYVPGAMGYVCRIDEDANGQILARDYFVYDGLGSCRALVSSNGIVVAKYDYDVYGSVRGQEGQRANSFKYVAQIGHPTDEETGLIYMRARYYDPEVGRFVSEDQKRAGMNFYWYADADPINNVDKTGAFSVYVLAALIYSAFVPFFNNPFLRPALEDFIGLPIDQQWVDRLAYYLERYVANYSNIGFIISLIPFPEECRFRPPEHWIEIEGGHCARGRHQFRTMMVNLITLWATMQWFGIVGVEIAFEEGI
jgi:RHS repeat-associated protein